MLDSKNNSPRLTHFYIKFSFEFFLINFNCEEKSANCNWIGKKKLENSEKCLFHGVLIWKMATTATCKIVAKKWFGMDIEWENG